MKSARLNALSRTPPTEEEAAIVHELFVKHRIPVTGIVNSITRVPIGDTALENTSMTHPQERKYAATTACYPSIMLTKLFSVHQKVFGGVFTMRYCGLLIITMVLTWLGLGI